MKLGIWAAVQMLAAHPQLLATFADELAKKDEDIHRLRKEINHLRSSSVKNEAAQDAARRGARRMAVFALADGWHLLRSGGDVLVKDGSIAKVRCADPERRVEVERAVRDDLGTWIDGWDDNGEADRNDNPF